MKWRCVVTRWLMLGALSVVLVGAAPVLAQVQNQYSYDGAGRLVQASNGSVTIDYQYDAGGNLLARTVTPAPEPGSGGALAALATLAALARRRR